LQLTFPEEKTKIAKTTLTPTETAPSSTASATKERVLKKSGALAGRL
jgi:hypothetical protein